MAPLARLGGGPEPSRWPEVIRVPELVLGSGDVGVVGVAVDIAHGGG